MEGVDRDNILEAVYERCGVSNQMRQRTMS